MCSDNFLLLNIVNRFTDKNRKHIRNNSTLALKGQNQYSINRLLDMLPKSIQLTGCTVSDPNYLHRLSKEAFRFSSDKPV